MVILMCAKVDVMKKGIWGYHPGDIKTTWRGRGDWTRLDYADYKDKLPAVGGFKANTKHFVLQV